MDFLWSLMQLLSNNNKHSFFHRVKPRRYCGLFNFFAISSMQCAISRRKFSAYEMYAQGKMNASSNRANCKSEWAKITRPWKITTKHSSMSILRSSAFLHQIDCYIVAIVYHASWSLTLRHFMDRKILWFIFSSSKNSIKLKYREKNWWIVLLLLQNGTEKLLG